MRVVDLHDTGTGISDLFNLIAQDRHTILDECLARRIRFSGLIGIPHAFTQQGRCGYGRFNFAVRELFHKLDLGSDEPGMFRRQPVGDNCPWPAIGGIGAQFEAMRQFGDHANIGLAPPFAVIDHIETGTFLQPHDIGDGGVHGVGVDRLIGDQVTYECRARHRTDDRCGKKYVTHTQYSCARSRSCCVSISMYPPGVSTCAK